MSSTIRNPQSRIGLRRPFAALAVARWLENTTGVSIKQFVKTLRRYRTIDIQAGDQTVTAQDPLPDNITDLLDRINQRR